MSDKGSKTKKGTDLEKVFGGGDAARFGVGEGGRGVFPGGPWLRLSHNIFYNSNEQGYN